MSETIATKLDEARALIEKGWTQRDYFDACGVCTYGALQAVFNGAPDDCTITDECEHASWLLKEVTGVSSIVGWNDKPGRTQAEVIEAFRKAAELARGDLVNPLDKVGS